MKAFYKSFIKALQKLYKKFHAYMFLKEQVDFLKILCILSKCDE